MDRDLLAEEFTADASPQLSARVGVALGSRRFLYATPFLQALAHRVQVTVRDHDVRHPAVANTHNTPQTRGCVGGDSPPNLTNTPQQ